MRVLAVLVLLVSLSGCTIVEGAWDALFGGDEEAETEQTAADDRTIVGESLTDEQGRFDPSRVLEAEDIEPLRSDTPAAPGGGARRGGRTAAEAAFDDGAGRTPKALEAADDETEKVVRSRNPPAPEPPDDDKASDASADLALEILAIAVLSALLSLLLRFGVHHPGALALVISLVALVVAMRGGS